MRIRILSAGALAALASALGAGPTLAESPTHTLTVTTKVIKILRYRDNEISIAELMQGRRVLGTDEGDCVEGPTTRCSAAYALTGGMIYAGVTATEDGEVGRITGGTGTFAGAHGSLTVAHLTQKSLKLTFRYTT